MHLSDEDREALRQDSKDEEAFQRLLTLIEQHHAAHLHQQMETGDALIDLLADQLGYFFLCFDVDLRCTRISPGSLERYGVGDAQMLGRTPRDLNMSGDLRRKIERDMRRALESRKPVAFELDLQGTAETQFQVHIVPQLDTNGGVQRLLAVGRDISEQHRLRRTQMQSQAMAASLFNSPMDSVFLLDVEGHLLALNDVVVQRLGRSRAELMGQNIFDFFPPDVAEFRQAKFKQVLDTQKPVMFEDERAGIVFSTVAYPVYNARRELLGVGVIGRDITDLRRMEQHIITQEVQYRQVVDNVQDTIFQISTGGKWAFLNPAWQALTGRTTGESIGEPYLDDLHPDDRAMEASAFESLMEGDAQSYRHVIRLNRTTGDYVYAEMFAQVLLGPHQTALGVTGILRDVTVQQAAEAAEREQQRLKVNLEKERELNMLKTRMMRRVNHEFRTPLAIVLTSSELWNYRGDRITPEKRQEYADMIRSQVRHLEHLLDEISTVVQLQETQTILAPTWTDLARTIEEAVESIRVGIGSRHAILLHQEGDLSRIWIDSGMVRMILTHLIHNAVTFSEPGTRIQIMAQRQADALTLRVRDEGIGINPEDGEHIYDSFFRGTNFDERPGLGLGLTMARNAVDRMGGTLGYSDNDGPGVTFNAHIPLDEPDERAWPL